MLEIMQEYKEVVVLMGSVANTENMTLFMQADLRYSGKLLHVTYVVYVFVVVLGHFLYWTFRPRTVRPQYFFLC